MATSIKNKSKNLPSSNSNKAHTQLKARSIVNIIKPQTEIDRYNVQSLEDAYIPSIQSTQLNKQDELTSVSYNERLLKMMKENGFICQPVRQHGQLVLDVQKPQLELLICTGHADKNESSGKCKCNKYYPPQFQLLGNSCHFCQHTIRFHRTKPELEKIVIDETKSETERNEYKYWFDKFITLQQLYCSTDKNLSYDDNLFITIYDKSRQATLSFIQSPNYKYVLIKYTYDSVYDEGENLFEIRYQIVSLQTMLPVKTDELLKYSVSYYQDNTQTENGFRTILWDLNQPATLIATSVVTNNDYQSFIEKVVNIECPSVNEK